MSLGTDLGHLAPSLKRQASRLAAVAEAWLDAAPASLADLVSIEGVRSGTLTLAVDGAAAKFRIDRALREGVERSLRERLPSIRAVRVRIATVEAPPTIRGRGADPRR